MANAYRRLNHTVGNETQVEDGFYYLNNFDHLLNSFGVYCPSHSDAVAFPLCPRAAPELVCGWEGHSDCLGLHPAYFSDLYSHSQP